MKKSLLLIITLLAVAVLAQSSLAVFWACFDQGTSIDFCNPAIPDRTAPSDNYRLCMSSFDAANNCYTPGNFNTCNAQADNECTFGNTSIDSTPPNLTITAPQNGDVFTERKVRVILSLDEIASVHFIDNNDDRGRWTTICSNCLNSDKERSFDEGTNNITFRATDRAGNEAFEIRTFFIDTQDPKVKTSLPKSGFASGEFFLEYDEDNAVAAVLAYGNNDVGMRTYDIDLETECILDRNYECTVNVDLSDYDNTQIEYYFNVTDIAGTTTKGKVTELDVDTTAPTINSLSQIIDGKQVTFVVDITETFFEEVTYIDHLDDRPKEKRLCSRLEANICEKRVSFNDGPHLVSVIAYDEVGHATNETVFFFTDSKDPKIKKTEPKRGYASGLFAVEFDEVNPVDLIMNYGNALLGFTQRNISFTFDNDTLSYTTDDALCVEDRGKLTCSFEVDVTSFDGGELDYYFTLSDIVGNEAVGRVETLDVDTTFPTINSLNYTIDGRRVEFVMNITEANLDEVSYIDNSDSRPRSRRMCSRLVDDNICEKTITLSSGSHDLSIQVTDEAGNAVSESLTVEIA